jgi:general secretion pathway protein L
MPAGAMTIALSSPQAGDIVRLVRQGVSWWLGELARMLPRRLTAWFGADAEPYVLMTVGPGGAALWPADAHRLSATTARLGRDGITIGLDRTLVFDAAIELPRSAKPLLGQILPHQIERLVPLTAGEARFDYRVTAGPDEKLLQVRVFVAKRSIIDEALTAARAAGVNLRRIVLADWQGPGKPPILWQADDPAAARRTLRRKLEIAAMLLAVLAYALYVHRLDRISSELQARITAAQPAAAAVAALARNVANDDGDFRFFARRRQEASPLEIIDALTRLVPTNSWLTRLVIDRRRIEISGYSPHATDLALLIERSGRFERPQFVSPITLAPDGKHEYFDLTFETKAASVR